MAVDSFTVFYSRSMRNPTKCCARTVMDRSRYAQVQNRNPTNFPQSNFIDDSSTYKHNFYITSLNFLICVCVCVYMRVRDFLCERACLSSWRVL